MTSRKSFAKALGPGLLFAGAAIGASHLVQSTRAGASFGLALLPVVLLANLIKYPAFSFGPRYASAAGVSLLEGYRRQGRWALALFGLVTLLSMFTVQAAVTFVTAGLGIALLEVSWNALWVSAGLMAFCLALLGLARYHWLDRIVTIAVITLGLGTFAATLLVLPKVDWGQAPWPDGDFFSNTKSYFFVAALVGWMPSAIDTSVWHSLWTLAKRRDTGHKPSVSESMLDFNIGYLLTAVLGLCFVLLGAGVVYGKGVSLPNGAAAFAASLIGLYTDTLGDWSRPLVGGAAFLVMFSTTLTVIDAFPRTVAAFWARLRSAEEEGEAVGSAGSLAYWICAALLFAVSLLILNQFLTHLKKLVDLATTISLVTAPILATLNHRAIYACDESFESGDGARMRLFSLICIGVMGLLAAAYLWLRLAS